MSVYPFAHGKRVRVKKHTSDNGVFWYGNETGIVVAVLAGYAIVKLDQPKLSHTGWAMPEFVFALEQLEGD